MTTLDEDKRLIQKITGILNPYIQRKDGFQSIIYTYLS